MITNVSKKIANLDFSEECKLEGSIEIIELSNKGNNGGIVGNGNINISNGVISTLDRF